MNFKLLSWFDDDGRFSGFNTIANITAASRKKALNVIIDDFENIFKDTLRCMTDTVFAGEGTDKDPYDFPINFEDGEYYDYENVNLFGYKFVEKVSFRKNLKMAKEFFRKDVNAFGKELDRTWSVERKVEYDTPCTYYLPDKFVLCENDMLPLSALATVECYRGQCSKIYEV